MSDVKGTGLLHLRDVSRTFGEGEGAVAALSDVTLTVHAGEFLALVGPSGSGKSSLLNLIGAMDMPTSGQVVIDGHDLTQLRRSDRAALRLHRLGFVFQAYNLLPTLSALENVECVLQLQGVSAHSRRTRAKAMLDAVGLDAHMHRRPDQLSGGQQQRVAVARALVGEPRVVLADEPTANLDSDTARSLMDIMHRLNRQLGTAFVFSTHDPQVLNHARRIVRLKDGRVVEDGPHALA